MMKTTNARDRFLAYNISRFCRSFLEHIRKYHRDPVSGGYTWAYQGPSLLVPIDQRDWKVYEAHGLFEAPEDGYPLTINDKLIGHVTTWNPYGYPRTFLVLHFTEEMQYRPAVILQFACYAGMIVSHFDTTLLTVERDPYGCKKCGKPLAQSIEGELICERCWTKQQMSPEEQQHNAEIEYWTTHCNEEGCGALLRTKREKDTLFCHKHEYAEPIVAYSEGSMTVEYYLTHCKADGCGAEIPEHAIYCKKHLGKGTYRSGTRW